VERSAQKATFLQYKIVQLKSILATRSHAFQLLMRARRSREMRTEAGRLGSHVVELFRDEASSGVSRGVELTGLMLRRVQAIATAEGSRVVLVLLPLAVQLSGDRFAQFAHGATGAGAMDPDRPQRVMTRVASEAGMSTVDLLPAFRDWAGAGRGELFLEREGHWNAQGHRVAAEVVVREMLARELVR
jgi:hypothetical protein